MPNLTLEFFYHCITAECFSITVAGGGSNVYTVKFDNISHADPHVEFEWSCTCMVYKMHKKCKHIERVIQSGARCGWMQITDGGEPIKENDKFLCPKCGKEALAQRWAV